MQIIKTKEELKKSTSAIRSQEKTLGLVCATGELNDAHAALIQRAVSENEVCLVSLFVSAKGAGCRNLMEEAELLAGLHADILFAPAAEEMYSPAEQADAPELDFGEAELATGSREASTFVQQLFVAACPTRAYFLEDDKQLAAYRMAASKEEIKITVSGK